MSASEERRLTTGSLGTEWLTTMFTSGMSRPLLATSVATSTRVCPDLKSARVAVRSFCGRMLCSTEAGTPTLAISWPTSSVVRQVRQNTMAEVLGSASLVASSSCTRYASLASPGVSTNRCSRVATVCSADRSGDSQVRGELVQVERTVVTAGEQVAVNSSVWRLAGREGMIVDSWSSKLPWKGKFKEAQQNEEKKPCNYCETSWHKTIAMQSTKGVASRQDWECSGSRVLYAPPSKGRA